RMAIVYNARHLRLNRSVALKMIAPGAYADLGQRERFQREAEAAACLQHANSVQVHEVGEWRAEGGNLPVHYFSLEFVDGGSLEEKVHGTPQPPRQAAELVLTLARAMHHAHHQ